MMKLLITSDLHLTDRACDEYRFGLFKWLAEHRRLADAVLILGDLTDKKDNHSSTLVNRIVDGLKQIPPPVFILRGNHDCHDPIDPFFRFLSQINGLEFFTDQGICHIPVGHDGGMVKIHMIPHCRTQNEFDIAAGTVPPNSFVCLHQTVDGSISESGQRLTGLKVSTIKQPKRIWSGDIHKPQKVGPVTYVGSPYHVRFGDMFTPRVILTDGKTDQNLSFQAPRKLVLKVGSASDIERSDTEPGDQVKLVIEMERENVVKWSQTKQEMLQACTQVGLEVFGVDLVVINGHEQSGLDGAEQAKTPTEILRAFCASEDVPSAFKVAGLELLGE